MKKIKGFTLIELIIVMAIMTILMAALMSMMKPIRSTYVDSTYYEKERNTQTGIAQYLTESLRYATNIGLYSSSGSYNVTNAIADFKAETGATDADINIITIDNTTTYTNNNLSLYGRLVRSKTAPSTGFTVNAAKANTTEARLALGSAYYGSNSYSISLVPSTGGFDITVSSILSNSLKVNSKKDDQNVSLAEVNTAESNSQVVSTTTNVICRNVDSSQTSIGGKLDITKFSGATTTPGTDTYIIFTLPQ